MRKWVMTGLIGAWSAVALAAPLAMAAPVPNGAATNGSPGQGLEISPPVVELSANPGQTVTTTIRVRNVTQGQLIAKGRADDFGAGKDEDGKPKLLLDETGATRYSLKYWVSGVPDLRLAPQELKSATVTIAVPANAEPGGHFGVVRFTAVPPELEGTGVALSASVGTLILLKVNGTVTDKLSLANLTVLRDGNPGHFFEYGPLDFVMRVRNDGSVHEKPQGSIVVRNLFGKTVATLPVNAQGGNVLPDSVRKFEQPWVQKRLLGRYTARLQLTYAGKQELTGSVTFWVVPWKLLLLLLVGVVALFWVLRLGLRKYNERIIARARAQQ